MVIKVISIFHALCCSRSSQTGAIIISQIRVTEGEHNKMITIAENSI